MDRDRRAVVSWWLYDWANSAFILTVGAGFFPIFFKSYWCASVDATVSTARLGMGNAAAGLIVAVLSPLLGAVADVGRLKKGLLTFFVCTGAFTTIVLFFMPQDEWLGALAVFLIASVGFNSANIFYDALLVDITSKEKMDWVSSVGYGIGYLGCGLLFLLNVLMVSFPSFFGLPGKATAVRVSFIMAAGWWLLFSVPIVLFVHERKGRSTRNIVPLLKESMQGLFRTAKTILRNRTLLFFLLAYWLYIDGLHTFVLMAIDFGMAIDIPQGALMVALIVVQFIGFPCTLLMGKLATRFSALTIIVADLLIYIAVCGVGALMVRDAVSFIVLAGFTGVAQGGIQALSRSYFGKIIPPESAAEYFGFYNVVSRFAVIFGPAFVGMVALFTRMAGVPSKVASRLGMSSVSLLFIVGAILLFAADKLKKENCG